MTPNAPDLRLARRHLRVGTWALVGFLAFGGALELLHAFKIGWLLDVGQEARRLSLRLAQAHGTLLGVLHALFGLLIASPLAPGEQSARRAAACFSAALVLLPGGFLLGALFARGGDPGPGILIAPIGAVLLFVGLSFVLRGLKR